MTGRPFGRGDRMTKPTAHGWSYATRRAQPVDRDALQVAIAAANRATGPDFPAVWLAEACAVDARTWRRWLHDARPPGGPRGRLAGIVVRHIGPIRRWLRYSYDMGTYHRRAAIDSEPLTLTLCALAAELATGDEPRARAVRSALLDLLEAVPEPEDPA